MSNANWLRHVCFNNPGHVGMNLMPLIIIGRKACLWARNVLWLLKNYKPQRH